MTLERTSSNFDVNAILSLLGSNGGDASDAFEAQPSTADEQPEYIYMTLGEKLQILREMESNSSQYADQAISRGLISPNQRADFQNLISANVRLMEEQRGNINFDPATSVNARLIDSVSPNLSNALDQIIVDRYVASNDQTNSVPVNTIAAVDPVAEAFASDVEEMTDDIRFNPSSNLAEEAAQILNSPLAARLDSGVLMNLRAAVNLQEEKQENGSGAFMRGETWNERREQTERERKEQARVADMADDAMSNQLSTVPDRYGLSQQNYAELNDDLKTRDGQERFMSFLRMMNPGMTDDQIRRRFEDAQIVAAVRSGQANDAQRRAYNGMSDERRDDASTSLAQYEQMGGSRFTPTVANRVDAQATGLSANASSSDPQSTTGASFNLLSGSTSADPQVITNGTTTTRVSVSAQVDGQAAISGAPSLRGQFGAALTATTPLDAPQLATVAAAPAPVVPAASAGLDV